MRMPTGALTLTVVGEASRLKLKSCPSCHDQAKHLKNIINEKDADSLQNIDAC